MKILIMIPAYNEAKNIVRVLERLRKKAPFCDYIVINDCSSDDTPRICRENGYNMLDLPINLGIGGGVQSGYMYAKENDYDIAIQMDGDGQHDPAYIETLIKPLINKEADMVIGSRFINRTGFQSSAMRRFGIQLINKLLWLLCRAKVTDCTSGFRACNKDLIHFYARHYVRDYPEPRAILAAKLAGYEIQEVPVVMNERQAGTSSINLLRSVYFMIKVSLDLILYRIRAIGRRDRLLRKGRS